MEPSSILSYCLVLLLSLSTCALTNITVDDTNSMINYKGIWDASDSHTSSLDYGGSHTLSSDSSASAIFTFTGVAVCVLYPLWPYPVSVMITVDGGVKTILNLTDAVASTTEPGGSESSQSCVRWCMTGLSNSEHEAVVTMPPSGSLIVVDAFSYTVADGSETSTCSTATASSASATSNGSSNVGMNGLRSTVLCIALGASFSGAILLTAIIFFLFRYRWHRNMSTSPVANSTINLLSPDDIMPTPYLTQQPAIMMHDHTCSTDTSPAPTPAHITETLPTSPPKSYSHSLNPTNPEENIPSLNGRHDLPSPAAGANAKSILSPSEQSQAVGEMLPPPSYSENYD
ncbi:hypothetical protein EDD85DRAFT_810245 [Armillaria nabsnona]|nr:hypothetical protein EDD85DRAFT_810245 [Armillaria nabsnona]